MKSTLTTALGCLGFLVAFGLVALLIGSMSGPDGSYDLDIVNRSRKDAVIQVSDLKEPIVVKAGEISIFHVDNQDKNRFGAERDFTIQCGDKTDKVKSKVAYWGHTVVDVTGDTNVAAVDYGRRYRSPDKQLPQGESDALVVARFKHPSRVYPVEVKEAKVKLGLGESLPRSIKVAAASRREFPELVRLLIVPADAIDNDAALREYVEKN